MKRKWQDYLTNRDWLLLYQMIALVKERGMTRMLLAQAKRKKK